MQNESPVSVVRVQYGFSKTIISQGQITIKIRYLCTQLTLLYNVAILATLRTQHKIWRLFCIFNHHTQFLILFFDRMAKQATILRSIPCKIGRFGTRKNINLLWNYTSVMYPWVKPKYTYLLIKIKQNTLVKCSWQQWWFHHLFNLWP